MQLFYNSEISESIDHFQFSKEESRHIIKVLRKQEGDDLSITNGRGWVFDAKIISADPKKCMVQILTKHQSQPSSYKLHLAVAPTKMNDRFEWLLEKATEIGLSSITPIICDRSERKTIKTERFEKILQSAMKQSLQYYLPNLRPLVSFKEFLSQDHNGQTFIAHCEDSNRQSLKSVLKSGTEVWILIGPEGDFTVKEIEMALQHNFIPVTLGTTRLRTETAAIVACHTVALINE